MPPQEHGRWTCTHAGVGCGIEWTQRAALPATPGLHAPLQPPCRLPLLPQGARGSVHPGPGCCVLPNPQGALSNQGVDWAWGASTSNSRGDGQATTPCRPPWASTRHCITRLTACRHARTPPTCQDGPTWRPEAIARGGKRQVRRARRWRAGACDLASRVSPPARLPSASRRAFACCTMQAKACMFSPSVLSSPHNASSAMLLGLPSHLLLPSPPLPQCQFPYMIDPNTGKEMYESDAIIEYMFKSYGNGEVGGRRSSEGWSAAAGRGVLCCVVCCGSCPRPSESAQGPETYKRACNWWFGRHVPPLAAPLTHRLPTLHSPMLPGAPGPATGPPHRHLLRPRHAAAHGQGQRVQEGQQAAKGAAGLLVRGAGLGALRCAALN